MHTHLERVRAGEVPRNGYLVTFLRLLLQYPEILQWEKLWLESEKGLRQEVYGLVKHLDPRKEVGLGILHWITSLDPFLRAQYDYQELIVTCDWVKPILYNVPAGLRFKAVAESFQATILKDASVEECVQALYRVLGHNEAPLDELVEQGFSARYVCKETRRLVDALSGRSRVYPGIGISLNSPGRRVRVDDTKAAIRAAYEGGADGILLARNYAETTLANLDAVGQVLKELGKV